MTRVNKADSQVKQTLKLSRLYFTKSDETRNYEAKMRK